MKKWCFIILCLFCLWEHPAEALSIDEARKVQEGLSDSAIENIGQMDETFSFYEMAQAVAEGTYTADLRGVLKKTLDVFFASVHDNVRFMGAVLLLGMVCTFIGHLEGGFSKNGVGEAAFLCCYAVLAGLTATGLSEASEEVTATLSDTSLFVKALVPTLTTLAIAEGRVISAPLMHTQLLLLAQIVSIALKKIILPLVYTSFALKFISHITASISLGHLSALADKLCKRLLAFMLLIFTAFLGVCNFAAGTAENMGMKTARFALGSFVPVAGGALAETVSALRASAVMIKSATGIAGIAAIALMSAYPVIRCAALSFLYNIAGAVLEPVCDKRLSSAVNSAGECMGLLFAVVSVNAMLYILSTAILLSSAGGSL